MFSGRVTRSVSVDAEGHFSIRLPADDYEVLGASSWAEGNYFAPAGPVAETIAVLAGETARLDDVVCDAAISGQ